MKTSTNCSYVFKEDNVKICTFVERKDIFLTHRKKYQRCIHDSVDWLQLGNTTVIFIVLYVCSIVNYIFL